MASPAQTAANIENAKHSTGPRTEEGKAASSRNGMTLGLYARRDFIRPDEEPDYAQLQDGLQTELHPVGIQEQSLVDEIRRATWRLRRCGEVEARLVIRLDDGANFILDPMEDFDKAGKIQISVDRARSQAHRLLHKCTAELRKLQATRQTAVHQTTTRTQSEKQPDAPEPQAEATPMPVTMRTQSEPSRTPRNAPCPCGSGQKHKRCCGRTAPPVLTSTPTPALPYAA